MNKRIRENHPADGIDRRGFLECMAWAGTGVLWTVAGGVLSSRALGQEPGSAPKGALNFVQISDSHIGEGPGAAVGARSNSLLPLQQHGG